MTSLVIDTAWIANTLSELRDAIAHVRARRGRDFIRSLPLGRTLDAIDAGGDPGRNDETVGAELGEARARIATLEADLAAERAKGERWRRVVAQVDLPILPGAPGAPVYDSCPFCDRSGPTGEDHWHATDCAWLAARGVTNG